MHQMYPGIYCGTNGLRMVLGDGGLEKLSIAAGKPFEVQEVPNSSLT